MCGRLDAVTERCEGLLALFVATFLVSDVANGPPDFLPYAGFQALHIGVGFVAATFGPVSVGIVFIGWVAKEIFFDNLTFGGSIWVMADSVADLGFGLLGVRFLQKFGRYDQDGVMRVFAPNLSLKKATWFRGQ